MLAGAGILFLTSTSAQAGYGHWLELQITNPDPASAFTFVIGETTCLNTRGDSTQMANSSRVTTGNSYSVPAHGDIVLGFNHDPASSCDSDAADFSIKFDTTDIRGKVTSNVVYFRAFENGEVVLNTDNFRGPTPYVGATFVKNGLGNSSGGRWQWVPRLPPAKLAKGQGHWKNVCNYVCSEVVISKGISSSKGETKENSSQRATMMSVTAEIGIEYAGASASLSTTSSDEKTVGESIAREISSGESTEVTQTYPKPAGWKNLWQWYVTMDKIGGGERLTFDSGKFTCSMTDSEPTYFPETEASESGLCDSPPPANAASAEVAAVAAAKARLQSCVTFYSALNGGGKSLKLCGADLGWKEYDNLGTPGGGNDFHLSVMSFQCAAGVGYVQFINGNSQPWGRHNESCKGGAMVNPNVWVKANATGVGLYAKPAKCCGE